MGVFSRPTEEEETNSNHVCDTVVTGSDASLAKLDYKFNEARGVGFGIGLELLFEGKDADLATGL